MPVWIDRILPAAAAFNDFGILTMVLSS